MSVPVKIRWGAGGHENAGQRRAETLPPCRRATPSPGGSAAKRPPPALAAPVRPRWRSVRGRPSPPWPRGRAWRRAGAAMAATRRRRHGSSWALSPAAAPRNGRRWPWQPRCALAGGLPEGAPARPGRGGGHGGEQAPPQRAPAILTSPALHEKQSTQNPKIRANCNTQFLRDLKGKGHDAGSGRSARREAQAKWTLTRCCKGSRRRKSNA